MKDIRQEAVSSSILQDPHFVDELQEIFKDIHRHPETGMQEVRTTALIKSIMDGLGVEQIELPGMNVGAACVIRGNKDGPTLALRADMDALPVQEATSLEYKSQNPGLMHACGHDLNTTVMLGVLKYAVRSGLAERMRGNLKFIFQPAEETLNGNVNNLSRKLSVVMKSSLSWRHRSLNRAVGAYGHDRSPYLCPYGIHVSVFFRRV